MRTAFTLVTLLLLASCLGAFTTAAEMTDDHAKEVVVDGSKGPFMVLLHVDNGDAKDGSVWDGLDIDIGCTHHIDAEVL